MELGYAFFVLLLYLILVLAGIWGYEYLEKRKELRKPVRLPMLTDREKQRKLNELLDPFGFAYDGRQDIFYSRTDSWQRRFGYGRIYDEAAALMNMIIDCEPIYFDYDERKWLIQFWKGQYGITTGGEAGVYYLPKGTLVQDVLERELIYRCVEDEDTLRIQTILWKNGKQLYHRRGYHWWLTGFVLGEYSRPKELEMDIEITLKDLVMRDAFLSGLYRAGYEKGEISFHENTVWIHFTKPHTRQPISRARWFSYFKQRENKRNCRLYRQATGDYANAYDKLLALKSREPGLYEKWERLARSRFPSEAGSNDQV